MCSVARMFVCCGADVSIGVGLCAFTPLNCAMEDAADYADILAEFAVDVGVGGW